MSASHTHALPSTGNERALRLALVLTFGFLMAEVVGGVLTGSLALISDAAHIFALAIALAAIRIARRPADVRRTYGYHRFEILAAFNALLLFAVALYILGEAYQRFLHPPEVHPTGMLVIAGIGLVVILVSLLLLSGGQVSLTAHVVHDRSFSLEGDLIPTWPSASRSFTRRCNAKPPPATARRGDAPMSLARPGTGKSRITIHQVINPKGATP
ncbi:MAG: cation transporter [Rhodocyclales bacterium]|nr:cation transporter [Rhodocyclales bacterium]